MSSSDLFPGGFDRSMGEDGQGRISPTAVVGPGVRVTGPVRVLDHACVEGMGAVRGYVRIQDRARVWSLPTISATQGNICLQGSSQVSGGDMTAYRGSILISDDAHVSEGTLFAHQGDIRVMGEAQVSGGRVVCQGGRVDIFGNARITGNPHLHGRGQDLMDREIDDMESHVRVHGNAHVTGYARVHCRAEVCGNATVKDYSEVLGEAKVSGDAVLGGSAVVTDRAHIGGTAKILGGVWQGDLEILSGTWYSHEDWGSNVLL